MVRDRAVEDVSAGFEQQPGLVLLTGEDLEVYVVDAFDHEVVVDGAFVAQDQLDLGPGLDPRRREAEFGGHDRALGLRAATAVITRPSAHQQDDKPEYQGDADDDGSCPHGEDAVERTAAVASATPSGGAVHLAPK